MFSNTDCAGEGCGKASFKEVKSVTHRVSFSEFCESANFIYLKPLRTKTITNDIIIALHVENKQTGECIFFLFPGPQRSLVQGHRTRHREIAITLASPI